MKMVWLASCITVLVTLFTVSIGCASGPMGSAKKEKTAILLASFGTTVPEAVGAITNITETVRKAYPETEVRITFTSNIIRSIWKKRQAEPQEWLGRGVPEEVLYVKNFIAAVGDLLEDGYTNIIVQPTHMFFMEQSHDLHQYVQGLASIRTVKERWKPIKRIVMGRPALGMPGDRYPYLDDVEAVCRTLAADAKAAQEAGAALVYMGHGNEYWSTGIYAETQKKLRELYPDVLSFIGVVKGSPSLDDVLEALRAAEIDKIYLKPFMIVAGDHATNDMAGPEADSWKSILEKEGYSINPVLQGLGENDAFARIFVDHIADAAREAHLELK